MRRLARLAFTGFLLFAAACPIPYGDKWVSVHGTVTDSAGSPLARARVVVEARVDGKTAQLDTIVSDSLGNFRIFESIAPMAVEIWLHVHRDGFADFLQRVDSAGDSPRGDQHIALRPARGGDAVAVDSGMTVDSCWKPEAGQIRLTGTVRVQKRFGPPGYGETPAIDERRTIVVLALPKSIGVCHQPLPGNERRVVRAREIQLSGAFDRVRLRSYAGSTVTAFARLHHQEIGAEYTDVIAEVDSIPDLRRPPAKRRD